MVFCIISNNFFLFYYLFLEYIKAFLTLSVWKRERVGVHKKRGITKQKKETKKRNNKKHKKNKTKHKVASIEKY